MMWGSAALGFCMMMISILLSLGTKPASSATVVSASRTSVPVVFSIYGAALQVFKGSFTNSHRPSSFYSCSASVHL